MVNLKVLPRQGKGRLFAYEAGGVASAAVLNFEFGKEWKPNGTAVTTLCQGVCSGDITIDFAANEPTTGHVAVAVLGYFKASTPDTLSQLSCTNGQVAKSDGSGGWACANDIDTDTNTLADLSCAEGQIAKLGSGGWACAADDSGGSDPNVKSALCDLYALSGESAPAALSCPAPVVRKVFITSVSYSGNLGNISGADAKCNTLATAAGLPGTYKAWLASNDASTAPDVRFAKGGATDRFELTNGNHIAIGWSDLTDGTLERGLDIDENGVQITVTRAAWSNVDSDGTQRGATNTCNNWTDDVYEGLVGGNSGSYCQYQGATQHHGASASATSTASAWSNSGSYCCDPSNGTGNPTTNTNAFRRLYCFQDLPAR